MKQFNTYERLTPDTVNGESLKIITIYSSRDKAEIDSLEALYEKAYGIGISREVIGELVRFPVKEIRANAINAVKTLVSKRVKDVWISDGKGGQSQQVITYEDIMNILQEVQNEKVSIDY